MKAVRHIWRVKTIAIAAVITLLGSAGLSQAAVVSKYGSKTKATPVLRKGSLPKAVSLKPATFRLNKIEYNQTQAVVKEIATTTVKKVEAKEKARKAQAAYQTSATRTNQKSSTKKTVRRSGSEKAQANAILASLIRRYPILKGTYIVFGSTPNGNKYQAVCYYTIGKIVINPSHTASLSSIIHHECMHVIDWREDHDIDHDDSW